MSIPQEFQRSGDGTEMGKRKDGKKLPGYSDLVTLINHFLSNVF